jgi:hypothetical protein
MSIISRIQQIIIGSSDGVSKHESGHYVVSQYYGYKVYGIEGNHCNVDIPQGKPENYPVILMSGIVGEGKPYGSDEGVCDMRQGKRMGYSEDDMKRGYDECQRIMSIPEVKREHERISSIVRQRGEYK